MKTLFLAVVLCATAAFAGPKGLITQEATGEAAIVNGDAARAAKEATQDALRTAVQQVAGVLLESDSVTANSQLVKDQIYAHSAGYVHSYKELSRKQDGGVVEVKVRAVIGKADLDKDLIAVQGLVKRLSGSKLVVLLNEQAVNPTGTTVSSAVTATVLTQAFKKDGWTLIDPSFLNGKVHVAPGVSLGQAEVKEIGNLTKADYVLYGTVNFQNQPPDPQFDVDPSGRQARFLVTGDYDFAVFATDSGTQIAKIADKFDSGKVNGQAPAVLTSYERTAFDIIQLHRGDILRQTRGAIVEWLRKAELEGRRLVLTVKGLPNYGATKEFLASLKDWSNAVKDSANVHFASGTAQADLHFVGNSDELADQLGGKKFHGRQVSVTGVSGNAVEVTLIK